MLFTYAPVVSQTQRDAIFFRMQAEGLLNCAMSALAAPTLADWRRITSPGGWAWSARSSRASR